MPKCFVIQPFDDENDRRYDEVYKPALEAAGVEPYRVDRDPSVTVPIEAIEAQIRESDICLADITTDNPNVWYELGFAFAVGRPVVMTCEAEARVEKLPFDIQHRAVIKYSTASPSGFKQLHAEVVKRVAARLNDTDRTATKNGEDDGGLREQRRLSQEAQEILKAAVAKDGTILHLRTYGSPGTIIKAGGKSMIPEGADHREAASWIAGLKKLEEKGHVKAVGNNRNSFEVTKKGYSAADEQRGVAVGFGWLQSVTIEESPVFVRGSTLHLARTTVVVGGNASGKTALCEWLAGSGDISLLKRWSALSKRRGRTQVRFDAVTPLPLTWTIRVFGESNIKFEMDGQAVPRLNLAHAFVYASERPLRKPEETTSSYLARWLRIDPAHIHNIVRSLAMRGGFRVHNPRFETREDHEALLLDLDGTVPGLEFRTLSSSEQVRVVIEFSVEFARFEAERKPTMLLIDCMGGFDRANFQEYLEFLATQSERFQIIITDRHGKTDRLDKDIEGLRVATLRGTESNVEIS